MLHTVQIGSWHDTVVCPSVHL